MPELTARAMVQNRVLSLLEETSTNLTVSDAIRRQASKLHAELIEFFKKQNTQ